MKTIVNVTLLCTLIYFNWLNFKPILEFVQYNISGLGCYMQIINMLEKVGGR